MGGVGGNGGESARVARALAIPTARELARNAHVARRARGRRAAAEAWPNCSHAAAHAITRRANRSAPRSAHARRNIRLGDTRHVRVWRREARGAVQLYDVAE